jgi:hypothetical protein
MGMAHSLHQQLTLIPGMFLIGSPSLLPVVISGIVVFLSCSLVAGFFFPFNLHDVEGEPWRSGKAVAL